MAAGSIRHPVLSSDRDANGSDEPESDVAQGAPAAPTLAGAVPADTMPVVGEDLYRLLVSSIRDYGIFMLDPRGRVASWNVGAQRIKGYLASEILGRHFSTFYPEEDRLSDKPSRELEIAIRDGRFEEEGWRIRKDGSRFWASVVITALSDASGQTVGFAKVTRDLTERRLAEQIRLADARRISEADSANRAKSEFLATMSHELRTPLNAIAGYADLLSAGIGGPVTAQQLSYLERIRSSEEHLLTIINDILNFARIEAGQIDYDIRPVSLRQLSGAIVTMLEPQATAKAIQVELLPGEDVIAVADRKRVEQILLNLLSNALKFSSAGGRITFSSAIENGQAVLRVQDSGRGIPEERLQAIFEPFVQVGRTLANPHEGTGLGLAISRDLARGMKGDLVAESRLGHGSVFILSLPVA